MRQRILLILTTLFACSSIVGQTINHKIVEEGKVWSYKGSRLIAPTAYQAEWDEIYSLEGDTVIDSRQCLKLYVTNNGPYAPHDHSYFGAMYEEGECVYYIALGRDKPSLLYNFSCESGTTIKVNNFNLTINNRKLIKYRGEFLTVIDWSPIEEETFYHGIWIEGIGSPLDLINNTPIWYDGCPYKELVTCKLNDQVIYDRDEFESSAKYVTEEDIAQKEYFPEGTRWTEIRLDTMKYDSWYSKIGDEWVPNFETIEYRVQGEYGKATDNYWNAPYKCVYTNASEWTDSLTLLISEGEINGLPTGVLVTVLDVDRPLWPSSYPFEWEVVTMIKFKDILAANMTALFPPDLFDFGIVEEIKEGDFGGARPLRYSDVKGVRMIQGIGVVTWNDGECIFGPLEPYNALPLPHEEPRHYRSMLVHFERDGEVLYDVWPEANESVTFTAGQMATIILPTEPDAGKGKYYRLDRVEGSEIVFEQELQPRAHVPYIIVPGEDFSIDPSALDLAGLGNDTVSIEGINFIGSYNRVELNEQKGFYIDIIDTTPDCGFMAEAENGAFHVGALRAWLQVTWNDPYNQGGTKAPGEKLQIVLKDNGTPIESPREEMVNGKCFDLSGRRLPGKPKSGLYIDEGRKRVR